MQRYFLNKDLELEQIIQLEKADNHHVTRVMRGQVNDELIIVDSKNIAYKAKIKEIIDGAANLIIVDELKDQQKELPIQVTIACGLSKNDKIDLIVQKATECGMAKFIPVALDRDVVKWKDNKQASKLERLERISKEAAEQCHRNVIPEISSLSTINKLVQEAPNYEHKLIAYEETAKNGQHGQLKKTLNEIQAGENLIIVFGSEGGLTEMEVAKLKEVGYIESSLGPRILRAETAPIYALSAISYQLEV
ncbi:16S rRNA (uracil(1498)-N(3))-methyltransferase [Aerococcaceae bacterium DSM 111021]|nr:16S rRNA (uracil(1498)-N(3))-methyltransferase [Aerococcaceae bacterium DSM 111021]